MRARVAPRGRAHRGGRARTRAGLAGTARAPAAGAFLLFVAAALAAGVLDRARGQGVDALECGAIASGRSHDACVAAAEGLAAFRDGNYRLALHRFREALDIDVAFRPALLDYWIGRSYVALGRLRDAAFAFHRAIRDEPPDSGVAGAAHLWLGKTYDLLGRRAAAVEEYRLVAAGAAGEALRDEARRYLEAPFDEDPVPGPPELRVVRAFLRALFAAEETHWKAYALYTDDLRRLRLEPPPGVYVEIGLLDRGAGFLAVARSVDGGVRCKVFSGRGTRPADRGVIFCP